MSSIEELTRQIDPARIPAHIAIIMDGNGRWARSRAKDRSEGHAEGVNSVHRITQQASDLGVKYLTLYAFSTENWHRPTAEVETLMHLIGWAIRKETPELKANNVKIRLIGEIDRLPAPVREALFEGVMATSECTGLNLCLCLSYSSRWELSRAVKEIATEVAAGQYSADSIREDIIERHLSTAGIPDPDLLIRTGGEQRLSNFLLWQLSYAELYFTPTLWPDFDHEEFLKAIADFQNRERRFGLTSDQVNNSENNTQP